MAFDCQLFEHDLDVVVFETTTTDDGLGTYGRPMGVKRVRAKLEMNLQQFKQMAQKAALSKSGRTVRGPFRVVTKEISRNGTSGSGS